MAPQVATITLFSLLEALANVAILAVIVAAAALAIRRVVRGDARRSQARLAEKQTADQAAAAHRTRQAQR